MMRDKEIEKLMKYGVDKFLEKLFKTPILSIFTTYHETHVKLVFRILQESNRDSEIQESLKKIKTMLENLVKIGKNILSEIPQYPIPPAIQDHGPFYYKKGGIDIAKARDYDKKVATYVEGMKEVINTLNLFIDKGTSLIKVVEQGLKEIESKLNTRNTKIKGFRELSNRRRGDDIVWIKLEHIDESTIQINKARALRDKYIRLLGMNK